RHAIAGKSMESVFVEAAAREDDHLLQALAIEDRSHASGVLGKIAAVDAHAADPDTVARELRRKLRHALSRLLRIVGINQQHDAVRAAPREILEGLRLVIMN